MTVEQLRLRVQCDLDCLCHRSLWLELKILLKMALISRSRQKLALRPPVSASPRRLGFKVILVFCSWTELIFRQRKFIGLIRLTRQPHLELQAVERSIERIDSHVGVARFI